MKDTDRERRVLIMALRYALQGRDDQGIHDIADQIRFRESDLPGIKDDARAEVVYALGKNEITVSTWVPLLEDDNDKM